MPKAGLEWHGSTLLRRTTGILARVTDGPVIVVRAAGQALPRCRRTSRPWTTRGRVGPVQGIAAGLAVLAFGADSLHQLDRLPFLHPAFVRRVLRAVQDGADVGPPIACGYPQPLAAAYRITLALVA